MNGQDKTKCACTCTGFSLGVEFQGGREGNEMTLETLIQSECRVRWGLVSSVRSFSPTLEWKSHIATGTSWSDENVWGIQDRKTDSRTSKPTSTSTKPPSQQPIGNGRPAWADAVFGNQLMDMSGRRLKPSNPSAGCVSFSCSLEVDGVENVTKLHLNWNNSQMLSRVRCLLCCARSWRARLVPFWKTSLAGLCVPFEDRYRKSSGRIFQGHACTSSCCMNGGKWGLERWRFNIMLKIGAGGMRRRRCYIQANKTVILHDRTAIFMFIRFKAYFPPLSFLVPLNNTANFSAEPDLMLFGVSLAALDMLSNSLLVSWVHVSDRTQGRRTCAIEMHALILKRICRFLTLSCVFYVLYHPVFEFRDRYTVDSFTFSEHFTIYHLLALSALYRTCIDILYG